MGCSVWFLDGYNCGIAAYLAISSTAVETQYPHYDNGINKVELSGRLQDQDSTNSYLSCSFFVAFVVIAKSRVQFLATTHFVASGSAILSYRRSTGLYVPVGACRKRA
jgi:hypothetical protein